MIKHIMIDGSISNNKGGQKVDKARNYSGKRHKTSLFTHI